MGSGEDDQLLLAKNKVVQEAVEPSIASRSSVLLKIPPSALSWA